MLNNDYSRRIFATTVALACGAIPSLLLGQRLPTKGEPSGKAVAALSNLPTAGNSADATAAKTAHAVPPGYRIGSGDVLQINVWKEPDASVAAAQVRSDGKISLPIIKEVEARGFTPSELEKVLAEKYSHFINSPEVAVVVKDIQSEKVYLVGAVKKEGSLLLKSPMTVLQVLAEAGGLTDFARRKKIYVLRTENQKQRRLPFNYDKVLKGEHMEQNVTVLPGDTIVVPQ